MDLERMTAKVRPRKGWEAIDLGVALVQQHASSLYKIWFITTFPIFTLAAILLLDNAVWAYVGFWFLKPFWERPLLHFLSRELFGERLSVKDCVKSFFHLAKIQWFPSITWRRLSFTRSLDLPIIQLEGLSGSQRSQRLKVIHSIGSGSAVWLTIFFVFLEIVFYFGIIALAYLLLPTQFSETIDFWSWLTAENEELWAGLLLNFVTYIAVSIVAPFFTACGFALYINQRTHLEAWDIELSFKRLAKRLTEQGKPPVVRLASILFAFGLAVSVTYSNPTIAAEPKEDSVEIEDKSNQESMETLLENLAENSVDNSEALTHKNAQEIIESVLAGKDFNDSEIDYRIRKRFENDKDKEKQLSQSSGRFSLFGYYLSKFFSFIVEFALWVFVAVVIIFLITRYRHLITGLSPSGKARKQRPKQLFGLNMSSEELPDQPWQVALKMINEEQYREALSLLYRASLIWYIDHTDVIIREGDTELECLKKLKSEGSQIAGKYLTGLTNSWRRLAYAHQIPEESVLTELCHQWPQAYAVKSQVKGDNDE